MSRKTRKLIWSAPLVAVLAVVGALAIFAAQSPGDAQATHEMLPGTPQNFTIVADGHHAIKLGWDAPSSGGTPAGYRIDRSEDNGTWLTHEPMNTGMSYTDSGLPAGMTYFYRVFAYNTAGAGPVSEDRTATTDEPTNPGRVRGLTATATAQNSIRLTWQAPEKNGGAPIKHYEIHFAPEPDGSAPSDGFPADTVVASDDEVDTVVATDGAVTTFNHGMLTAETRYRYIVYAVNDKDIKSTEDSALRAATTDDLTAPGRPTALTAVQSAADTVQLYWYAPANTGGTAITAYDTEVRPGCSGDWGNLMIAPWTNEPTDAHDASYTIETGEDRPTVACFRTRAHNSSVDADAADLRYGGYTSSLRLVLHATGIPRELAVPPAVAGGQATYTTDKAKVTWRAADLELRTASRVSGYRVDVSEDGISWESIRGGGNTNRADDEGNPYFEYNYDGGAPRIYRVFARVAQTFGPAAITAPSAPLTGEVTAPGQVRNLNATASGPTQIDLTWNAPTSDGGAPIDHYIVQASQKVEEAFAAFSIDLVVGTAGNFNFKSETTSYAHTALKAGETWRYRVFAVNKDAAGDTNVITIDVDGDEAEVDQATTHQETKPRMPEYLSIEVASTSNSEAAGSTGLLLLWNAPQDPAGADVSGYQVQRMSNDGPWATQSPSPNTGTTFTDFTDIEGLEEDETRAYRVRAISENGVEGAWSDAAYHPAMRTHEPAVPTEPSMVMASSDVAGELMLTWEGGANADSYLLIAVNMADTSDYKTAIVSDGAAQMGTLAGLTSGVNYLGIVVALQGTGAGRTYTYGASGVQAVQ